MSRRSFNASQRFADLKGMHPATLRALDTDFKYERMSRPQAAYLPAAMDGSTDLLVRARTGSGKTLGFLIPLLQRVAEAVAADTGGVVSGAGKGTGIAALVVSPARELAEQTAREATRLAAFHRGVNVQVVIGGTKQGGAAERRRLGGCNVLVATPGRLLDHVENTPGFAARLHGARVLVLDEADRLLDPGFAPAVRRIVAALGRSETRQTLLFTATVPPGVQQVAEALLRPSAHAYIDTAANGSRGSRGSSSSLSNVRHESLVLPVASLLPALHLVLHAKRKADPAGHKVVVFVQTALMAQLLAEVLRRSGFPDAIEMHSRLEQRQRSAAARRFLEAQGAVMVASDVFARGIDVPNVTLVVQLGIAADAAQVVHRAGRTGRAGRSGEALMLLAEDEDKVLAALVDKHEVPVVPAPPGSAVVGCGIVSGDAVAAPPALAAVFRSLSADEADAQLLRTACRAFVATLGFYKSNAGRLGWKTPERLVQAVVERFLAMGLRVPATCPVPAKTLGKMRLRGVAGLNEAS